MKMRNALIIFTLVLLLSSCKTNDNADCNEFDKKTDSLKNELSHMRDSVKSLHKYIDLIENDNQILGSELASREFENYNK